MQIRRSKKQIMNPFLMQEYYLTDGIETDYSNTISVYINLVYKGFTDYNNKIVLCGKVVCPDLSLMEHGGVIYLFRSYIADGTAIVLHSRNYKKILSYKQYPSTW